MILIWGCTMFQFLGCTRIYTPSVKKLFSEAFEMVQNHSIQNRNNFVDKNRKLIP